MKHSIDMEELAKHEAFGVLAVRGNRRRRPHKRTAKPSAQEDAFVATLRILLEIVRKAGAKNKRIQVGDVFLKLSEKNGEEILSVSGKSLKEKVGA